MPTALLRKISFAFLSVISGAPQLHAQDVFTATFDRVAARHAPMALAAGYVVGQTAPLIHVAGRTRSDGGGAVAADAPWHIGSITKSFTATLVMQMHEAGQIDIDVPIGAQFPELSGQMHRDWQGLTFVDLLGHTAGLPADTDWDKAELAGQGNATAARRTALSALWGKPIQGKQGQFSYSNLGYVLAGYLIELRARSSWEMLVKQNIAQPLGLHSLGFGPPSGPGVAFGHRRAGLRQKPVPPTDPGADNPPVMGPAGRIHISVPDLLKWGQAHLNACRNGGIITVASCQRMQHAGTGGMGLGWGVQNSKSGLHMVLHDGSNTRWYAFLVLVPERDAVLVVVQNDGRSLRATKALRQLAEPLLGRLF
ncbi:MAG: serine hydrolase domain-containing protein [Paracoccaceae bacterium]